MKNHPAPEPYGSPTRHRPAMAPQTLRTRLDASAACDLAACFDWCRQICARSGSSFVTSFRLLDLPRRRAMYALYAFARITDDLGDSSAPSAQRERLLVQWQARLRTMATPPASPAIEAQPPAVELESFELLWPALADAVETFDIPTELLHAIIEGVRRDVYPTPPADWPELVDYCYHVASAVGLACVHIWKQEPEIPTQAAVDCGIAFQLTNILRDVAEDARQGRLYLPLTELQRFQIDPDQWLNGQPNGRWPELIEHVAHRAEEYYQRGWPTIESLSPRSRRMFSLMWCSYRMLLGRVVARRHRLWQTPRIGLSTIQRFHLLARHMVSSPNQR